MKTWSFDSPDPETTHRTARLLGPAISADGVVIGLIGPLGAGKTVFARGLAEGLGVQPSAVSSPTFVIAQQYPIPTQSGSRPHVLHHVDLYRLESESELDAIGFEDLFERGSVVAAEWCDRFPDVLGPERIEIELEGPSVGEATRLGRHVEVRAHGAVAETTVEEWAERVERSVRAEAAQGEGHFGAGPRQRIGAILLMALALVVSSRFETDDWAAHCDRAESVAEDAFGTLRVRCTSAFTQPTEMPHGIGGLLFGQPMSIDHVSAAQLEALPGIGPSRATAIVEARQSEAFERLSDLERVSGIGPKTVRSLSRWLTIDSPTRDDRPLAGARDEAGFDTSGTNDHG